MCRASAQISGGKGVVVVFPVFFPVRPAKFQRTAIAVDGIPTFLFVKLEKWYGYPGYNGRNSVRVL